MPHSWRRRPLATPPSPSPTHPTPTLHAQNSSLVLTSDVKRETGEPTGEPETLAGRITHKMGDRVLHAKPDGLVERKERSKCVSPRRASGPCFAFRCRAVLAGLGWDDDSSGSTAASSLTATRAPFSNPHRKREAKQAELEFALPAKSRKTAGGMSVMDLDTAGFYRPRTKETRWVGEGSQQNTVCTAAAAVVDLAVGLEKP